MLFREGAPRESSARELHEGAPRGSSTRELREGLPSPGENPRGSSPPERGTSYDLSCVCNFEHQKLILFQILEARDHDENALPGRLSILIAPNLLFLGSSLLKSVLRNLSPYSPEEFSQKYWVAAPTKISQKTKIL